MLSILKTDLHLPTLLSGCPSWQDILTPEGLEFFMYVANVTLEAFIFFLFCPDVFWSYTTKIDPRSSTLCIGKGSNVLLAR